jgi:predicted amidohydrolase
VTPINSTNRTNCSRWAVLQVDAGDVPEENLNRAIALIEDASESASLVALPEFFIVRGSHETILETSVTAGPETLERLAQIAEENDVNILAGSVPFAESDNPDKCYNRSVLLDTDGEILARYDKIHRFDVDLDDGITVRESSYLQSGSSLATAQVDGFKVGLSICYDLRFPKLYQSYGDEAVDVIFVPSNFTRETGRAHWLPLLRARAIENQCYVVAPNQLGKNPHTGVASLGQSCVVDPWGSVVTCCPDRESWATAELDPDYLEKIRRELPSLSHRDQTPDSL